MKVKIIEQIWFIEFMGEEMCVDEFRVLFFFFENKVKNMLHYVTFSIWNNQVGVHVRNPLRFFSFPTVLQQSTNRKYELICKKKNIWTYVNVGT